MFDTHEPRTFTAKFNPLGSKQAPDLNIQYTESFVHNGKVYAIHPRLKYSFSEKVFDVFPDWSVSSIATGERVRFSGFIAVTKEDVYKKACEVLG